MGRVSLIYVRVIREEEIPNVREFMEHDTNVSAIVGGSQYF